MIESLLFIITLFKVIVKIFFPFEIIFIYLEYFRHRFRCVQRKRCPFTRGAFCVSVSVFGYKKWYTKAKLRGYRGGCGPAKRRELWKRKSMQSDAFGEKSVAFQGMCGPVCQNGALCPSGSARFCLLPKRQPDAAPPVLPQDVSPSCETFSRRLASWRTCIRRAGRVHIGAWKIGKSGVLSVDGPRGNLSGRRKRRSAKSRRCEAGCPVGELPSGGGMPSDGECRPKTLFAGSTRQAAGEFCRNTQVKREVIHLSTRLSTMPGFYAVKKPQKRAGKKGRAKGNCREKERI